MSKAKAAGAAGLDIMLGTLLGNVLARVLEAAGVPLEGSELTILIALLAAVVARVGVFRFLGVPKDQKPT